MLRYRSACSALSLLFLVAAGCSSSGGGGTGDVEAGGDFFAVRTEPVDGATIYLNDPVAIDFSTEVDIDSASLMTVSFTALGVDGLPAQELVAGAFQVGTRPGDDRPGRRLLFVPRYPDDDQFQNGGLRAGRRYLVQLVGGKALNGTTLRDTEGNGLAVPLSFRFDTVDGTQPQQLFRNPAPGGPRRAGLDVTSATSLDRVPLGLFGAPPVVVRASFDQALNPHAANVPTSFDPDPLVRDIEDRGRIYLEYKDPEFDDPDDDSDYTWIPADVEIERNDLNGATVALRPVGVLPNNAEVRVIVTSRVEDLSGESNDGVPDYSPVFGTFRTNQAYEQQWNAVVETFRDESNLDLTAPFPEALAEVGPGYLRAGFEFSGNTTADYRPTASEIVLNTAFTTVVPQEGLPFTVNGGVFQFRNVTIPQGVVVQGQGPNPMIWRCTGDFTVEGTLTVRGGDGARVNTLNSANTAKAGGIGVCGGGNGGAGSPSGTSRDPSGEPGYGPGQEPQRGGGGGVLACFANCYTDPDQYNGSGGGSGGGGGSMATQGDPNWLGADTAGIQPNTAPTANTAFQQLLGYGGAGCSGESGARTEFLVGGVPGDLVFEDSRIDNDFWGSGIDLNRGLRVTGELSAPSGGGGGGGGGDTCTPNGQPWINDFSGGGGGGGGGVLIVQALGEIRVARTGRIVADGGHGGGGESGGASGEAGGGGGGAGGMVVLMSSKRIVIEAHGDAATNRYLYGNPPNAQFLGNDYNFAISADGGVCTTGGFAATDFSRKYPTDNGDPMMTGAFYDANPVGGMGGMGIVQLMVPPGDNSDGTNTILDDNIVFEMPGGFEATGLAKQQLLAWRGFNGLDDEGLPTNIGENEGDIRPAPVLLPSPLQARSRMRSKWIDTGRSQRRPVAAEDGLPRGLLMDASAQLGPVFDWSGTDQQGFVRYERDGESVARVIDTIVEPVAVETIDAAASYLGRPAYRVDLVEPVFSTQDRYVQYQAELLDAADNLLAGFRIVHHDDRSLYLDPDGDVLPAAAASLRVRAKFFEIATNGNVGFGPTYSEVGIDPDPIPVANVRIGFAFHRDPDPNDILAGRYPNTDIQDFVYDLSDPGLRQWLEDGAPRYVMWDVMFDLRYKPTGAEPPSLSSSTPRPELRFLRLPFRF